MIRSALCRWFGNEFEVFPLLCRVEGIQVHQRAIATSIVVDEVSEVEIHIITIEVVKRECSVGFSKSRESPLCRNDIAGVDSAVGNEGWRRR